MRSPNNPAASAAEAQLALTNLAHETRAVEDPRQIYEILGCLSAAATSLGQSLHQLASLHDRRARETTSVAGDSLAKQRAGREVSWELHRAAEIAAQVSEAIDHAHEAESTINYTLRALPSVPRPPQSAHTPGVGL